MIRTDEHLRRGYEQIGRLDLLDQAREWRLSYVLLLAETIDGREFLAVRVPGIHERFGYPCFDYFRGLCAECGKEFCLYTDTRRRYCTPECRDAFLRRWHSKAQSGYWSKRSRREYAGKSYSECQQCGGELPDRPSQKYCSSRCRRLAWWHRNKARNGCSNTKPIIASSV